VAAVDHHPLVVPNTLSTVLLFIGCVMLLYGRLPLTGQAAIEF